MSRYGICKNCIFYSCPDCKDDETITFCCDFKGTEKHDNIPLVYDDPLVPKISQKEKE